MRTLRCRRMADLPALADGEDLVALNVTVGGRLIALSTQGDRHNRLKDPEVRAHLHEAGDGWRSVALTGVTVLPSKVELLPDGHFLLARSRSAPRPSGPAPDNAQVFDPAGRALRSFRL